MSVGARRGVCLWPNGHQDWTHPARARLPALLARSPDAGGTGEDQIESVRRLVRVGFTQTKSEEIVLLQSEQARAVDARLEGRFSRIDERFSRIDERFSRLQWVLVGTGAVLTGLLVVVIYLLGSMQPTGQAANSLPGLEIIAKLYKASGDEIGRVTLCSGYVLGLFGSQVHMHWR